MLKIGKIRISAIVFSVTVHLLFFIFFCEQTFSIKPKPQQQQNTAVLSSVITDSSLTPIMPKPAISDSKRIVFENLSSPQTQNQPLFPKIPQSTQQSINQQSVSDQEYVTIDTFFDTGAEFFNIKTQRKRVCYVVDSSGSMHGSFGLVRQSLSNSIMAMEPDCFFFIIFYGNENIFTFSQDWTRASPIAKKKAHNFITDFKPAGKTNSADAIKKALDICSGQNSKNTIFFLTDGFELTIDSPEVLITQIENYRQKTAPLTQINTLGFDIQGKSSKILEKIAELSGGSYNIIR